ncbi:MAG: Hpt domain-containing protein [Flavobacteriales bacterium]|nr:Hpt domain-containing protein [Flavobacteriales bacterium]
MNAELYNLSYLQEVFQGNDAMVRRILDLFEVQVPGYFDEMESRLAHGQWRQLHPLAHKAKSSLGMLGMEGVLYHTLHIETVSRSGLQPEDIPERLRAARAALDLAMAALSTDRDRLHLMGAARTEGKTHGSSTIDSERGLKRA